MRNLRLESFLDTVAQIKLEIKQFLIDKGVNMNDVIFSEYPNKLNSLVFDEGIKNSIEMTEEEFKNITPDKNTIYVIIEYYTEGSE